MKEGIHPNYQQTTITCACGNVIETGSCTLRHIQQWSASADHCFFIAFFQNSDILDTSMKWETHLTRGLPNARRDTFVTEKGRNSR
ncbi:MAG: 50S ribosomal protein L31 [Oscillibacter sp.]|nr:50S ribosomal protein L31 [Oscillibacter sp.]